MRANKEAGKLRCVRSLSSAFPRDLHVAVLSSTGTRRRELSARLSSCRVEVVYEGEFCELACLSKEAVLPT